MELLTPFSPPVRRFIHPLAQSVPPMSSGLFTVVLTFAGSRGRAPVALVAVTPRARRAVEGSTCGLTLGNWSDPRSPALELRVGLSQADSMYVLDAPRLPIAAEVRRARTHRRPTLLRQLSIRGLAPPTCMTWWLRRSASRLPLALQCCNLPSDGTLLPVEWLTDATGESLLVTLVHVDKGGSAGSAAGPRLDLRANAEVLCGVVDVFVWDDTWHTVEGFPSPTRPLPHLRCLCLRSVEKGLGDLSALHNCRALQALVLLSCSEVRTLDALAELPSLRSLSIAACNSLSDIRGFAHLVHLEHLGLHDCHNIDSLGPLQHLRHLRSLSLRTADAAFTLDLLPSSESLETLTLSCLAPLDSLCGLNRAAPFLRELTLCAGSLASVRGLETCEALQRVHLTSCPALRTWGAEGPASLKEVSIQGCADLANLDGLGRCPGIAVVEVFMCRSLTTVRGLAAACAGSLRRVVLAMCPQLVSLDGLAEVAASGVLAQLVVTHCGMTNPAVASQGAAMGPGVPRSSLGGGLKREANDIRAARALPSSTCNLTPTGAAL